MKRIPTRARLGLVTRATVVGLTMVGLTTVGLVATGTPALAADDTLPTLKAALTARIDLRLAALAKDTAAVAAAKHLTGPDRTSLTGLIAQDTDAMNALKGKVAGETTAAALKADATTMVDDYRIFLLVGPKVRLTIAGDAEQVALTKARQAHDKLAGLVAQAKTAGTDTAAAEADLTAMQTAIDSAGSHLDGQVAAVLAIQPGPDGAAIRARVAAVRLALGGTRSDLKAAVAAGRRVAAFLKTLPSVR